MLMLIVAAASLLLADAAPAADPAKPAAARAEKPAKPKMVCTDEEQVGSLMRKRVCRPAKQAEAERLEAERQNQDIRDHYAVCRTANC
jgi:hypothetical protein